MTVAPVKRNTAAAKKANEAEKRAQMAKRAHQMRREGMSWWDIAETLKITEYAASALVSERIRAAAELVDEHAKREMLTMEIDRLDQLQRAVWTDAIGGDRQAVETCLKIIQTRSKILGLDQATDTSTTVNTIVVPGNSAEYIAALQAVRSNILEAS